MDEEAPSSSSSFGGGGRQEADSFKGHPKRLDDETAGYLVQVDSQFGDDAEKDEEEINVLVENVLDEIRQRTASAACDRRTHAIV